MFRFANPQYLWLLLAVPALVALYWLRPATAADGSHASAAPAFWRS